MRESIPRFLTISTSQISGRNFLQKSAPQQVSGFLVEQKPCNPGDSSRDFFNPRSLEIT